MGRPKLGDSETERLHVKITEAEIVAIDDFRYANRIPSRSEAVRRLVQIGLNFDARAQLLNDALAIATDNFEASMQMVINTVGQPVEGDPVWLPEFIEAMNGLAKTLSGDLVSLLSTVRPIARAREIMNTTGSFDEAFEALKLGELKDTIETLEANEAVRQRSLKSEKKG